MDELTTFRSSGLPALVVECFVDCTPTEIAYGFTFNSRPVCPGTLKITPGTDPLLQELDPEVLMRPVGFAPR